MRILVAIPVYNEEQYVTGVLAEVGKYTKDILVVDDGSTDETPSLLARQPVDVVRHKRNRGYGRSIRDAIRWASCYGYDWLITMDCDEQHEPRSLPDFFEAIEKAGKEDGHGADIISGSRYLHCEACGGGELVPEDRREINKTVTGWVKETLGYEITDSFCGFKACRVSGLRKMQLDRDGYAIPLQFWVQAKSHGLKVDEVPIRLIYNDPNRSFGEKLDDPAHRIALYREVWENELSRTANMRENCMPADCVEEKVEADASQA
ncbi:Undecaprenyl-phosphate mannosyltransferase [Poriferisphaera corsica]|uniref:Undecaprenyl-phosphate mannosyltransferase n=1 Tax=Poriferisphaera corsica TaxID=2528020 RepID=A0A517YRG8_9BACT|nr:glycosyltransferase family 2 protein [Poriferisphaera corsica]QDU32781.1 Undecaprenyl-phosphate mannosyltransferase [Poriferisphaera corsica]